MESKSQYHWLSWVVGGLLFIMMLSTFGMTFLGGLLTLIASLCIFPPLRMLLHHYTQTTVPAAGRVAICILCMFATSGLVHRADQNEFSKKKAAILQDFEQAMTEHRYQYVIDEISRKYSTIEAPELAAAQQRAKQGLIDMQEQAKRAEAETARRAVVEEQRRFDRLSPEEKITLLANKTWGDTSHGNGDRLRPRVISVKRYKQLEGEDRGGYLAEISYRTDGKDLSYVTGEVTQMIQAMLAQPYCSDVKVFLFLACTDFADKYGQVSEWPAVKINIRRATVEKINWDYLSSSMFLDLVREEQGLQLNRAWTK